MFMNKNTPGPGNYDTNDSIRRAAPSFGFGSGTRDGMTGKKMNVPGPGTYRLRSSISDLPSYAMPEIDSKYKYV